MDNPVAVKKTVPGVGQARVYVVKNSILQGYLPQGAEASADEEQ